MIKLIATDMDGTLLDENSNLPNEFFPLLEKLHKNNIKFVVASGRPYKTLYENFKPYSNDLSFICDNGSYIVEEGKEPSISFIKRTIVDKIIKACSKIHNTTLVLCGTKYFYHTPCDGMIFNEINKYYNNNKVLDDLTCIDDEIFKIAICNFEDNTKNTFEILNNLLGDDYKVVISGSLWIDVTNKNINKGSALKKIQDDYDISPKETMVFGDFYNDIEMLEQAYYSFVMENANEDMKKYGNFIAKSNIEHGVLKSIEEYVFN